MKNRRKKKGINKFPAGFWGMSKPVMGAVIVACIIAAVIVLVIRSSGGDSISSAIESAKGQMIWMKCNNPDCGEEYQIDKVEYKQYLNEHQTEQFAYKGNPPLPCKECDALSLLPAVKCPKCGNVFFKGAMGPGEFSDKCPECEYSVTEVKRKGGTPIKPKP